MTRIEAYKEMVRGNKICHKSWIGTGKFCFCRFNNDGLAEFFVQTARGRRVVDGDMIEPDFYLVVETPES